MAVYSGPGYVLFEGVPVLQASNITYNVETDNKDVNTLILGRSGFSPGPKKVQVSVDNAIPAEEDGGMELDWPAIAEAQLQVSLAFVIAGVTRNATGDVRGVSAKTSTESANSVSFEFHGTSAGSV